MKSKYVFLLCILVSLFVVPSAARAQEQKPRTWNSADGRFSVEAVIVGLKAGKASLRKADGKVVEVSMKLLSPADQAYIDELKRARQAKQQTTPNTTTTTPAANDKIQTLSIPGVFSIKSPGNGFAWNTGGERVVNGVQAYRLGCSKAGSSASVTLIVQVQKGDTDEKRALVVKTNYQAVLSQLNKAKFTELKSPSLKVDRPIPDLVTVDITGRDPNNGPAVVRIVNIFKENTYSFQINGASKAEVDQLSNVIKTLTEIGTAPEQTKQQASDGRFRHATYGFSYMPPQDLKLVNKPQPGVVALFGAPSGANVFFRCLGKSDDFDLNKMFSELNATEPSAGLDDFQSLGTGDIQLPAGSGKFRSFAYSVKETPLKVVQYYFTSEDWVYIVTATTRAEDFDGYRESFDASIKDVKFF